MWIARRRLAEDVARWRDAGWVTAEGEAHIRYDLIERRSGPGLAAILGILGVVLLGFAVMSFVAANWQEMPRIVRLGLIFAGLFGAYAGAAAFFQRGLDAFGHAAILLGVAVFGAGIMLIAQMYHIEGHPPGAVLVWSLGALGAGVLLGSNPALAAAAALFGLWSGWEMSLSMSTHWPLLLAAAALAAAFLVNRWWPGIHLVGVLVTGWLITTGYLYRGGDAHTVVLLVGLAIAGLAVFMAMSARRSTALREPASALISDFAAAVLGYGMIAAFAGFFALQFVIKSDIGSLIALAAVSLALLVGAIYLGLALGFRGTVWLGYVGFSIEILALYFKTVGSLQGSSLFFFVAGLIVIALAYFAWRLHRVEENSGMGELS